MIKEACVETFEEAKLAELRGANRIELCSDLANDGLTSSFELIKNVCTTFGRYISGGKWFSNIWLNV